MSYHVLDICYYIILYSNNKGYGVSNLKLQKLLYFIQAWFLVTIDNPCFIEKIEACNFDVIISEAYKEFGCYGSMDIPSIKRRFEDGDWKLYSICNVKNIINIEDIILINQVLDKFAEYSATDLLALIHNQKPWLDAYYGDDKEITNEALLSYFKS